MFVIIRFEVLTSLLQSNENPILSNCFLYPAILFPSLSKPPSIFTDVVSSDVVQFEWCIVQPAIQNCHSPCNTLKPWCLLYCIHIRSIYPKGCPTWRPALMDKETYLTHNALFFRVVCSGNVWFSAQYFCHWPQSRSDYISFPFLFILTESCCRWSSSHSLFLFLF
jgi:hypothetical protein